MPVFTPGPTTRASTPNQARAIAAYSPPSLGTTEETAMPVTAPRVNPSRRNRLSRSTAISSPVEVKGAVELMWQAPGESLLDEMWTVNTKGPLRVIRAAFPLLKKSGHGRVVNIVSLSGKRVYGDRLTGYAMSKFATLALTHAVRYTGWEHGIRSTAICPGFVATDMTADVTAMPHDKMIQPGAIADLVATVLSLPNNNSVVEIPVNCRLEHSF